MLSAFLRSELKQGWMRRGGRGRERLGVVSCDNGQDSSGLPIIRTIWRRHARTVARCLRQKLSMIIIVLIRLSCRVSTVNSTHAHFPLWRTVTYGTSPRRHPCSRACQMMAARQGRYSPSWLGHVSRILHFATDYVIRTETSIQCLRGR